MKYLNNMLCLVGLCGLAFWACGDDKTAGGVTEETQGIAIVDKTVSGVSQKGPFVKGSSVHLYGLNPRTLAQTGSVFMGKVNSDKGDFSFSDVNLKSQYVLLEAEGFYRNEITGEKSNAPITLLAVSDLSKRETVNINLLTNISFDRVLYLVKNGMSVAQAKKQAEEEVLKAFYMDNVQADFEDLNIFNEEEGDAALLGISILLQQGCNQIAMLQSRSEADLVALMSDISLDLEKDGLWNNDSVKTQIADCFSSSNPDFYMAEYRRHIESWNLGTASNFEKYAHRYWWYNYGLGDCSEKNRGETKPNLNAISSNANSTFTCDENGWREATDKEIKDYQIDAQRKLDTEGWDNDAEAGEIRHGDVDPRRIYVFDGEKWFAGDDVDSIMIANGGAACAVHKKPGQSTSDKIAAVWDTSSVTYLNQYFVCDSATGHWNEAPMIYTNTVDLRDSCRKLTEPTLLNGTVYRNKVYWCADGVIREFSAVEKAVENQVCDENNIGEYVLKTLGVGTQNEKITYARCSRNGWMVDEPLCKSEYCTTNCLTFEKVCTDGQLICFTVNKAFSGTLLKCNENLKDSVVFVESPAYTQMYSIHGGCNGNETVQAISGGNPMGSGAVSDTVVCDGQKWRKYEE